MTQPPPEILELIERFDRNQEAYRSPHYNETGVRREFLDPFFRALGWDIRADAFQLPPGPRPISIPKTWHHLCGQKP